MIWWILKTKQNMVSVCIFLSSEYFISMQAKDSVPYFQLINKFFSHTYSIKFPDMKNVYYLSLPLKSNNGNDVFYWLLLSLQTAFAVLVWTLSNHPVWAHFNFKYLCWNRVTNLFWIKAFTHFSLNHFIKNKIKACFW